MAASNLQHDLKSIQSAITSMLGKMSYSPSVPSWRYPEKMAVAVELDGLIPPIREEEEAGDRLLLTELMVDRLLLLLQLAVAQLIRDSSHHRSAIPLTLSSAVRKLSKYVLTQHHKEEDEVTTTTTQSAAHEVVSRHVQTIETALSVCSQCDVYHQSLLEISNKVRGPSTKQQQSASKILRSILDNLDMMDADRKSSRQQCDAHQARIIEQDNNLDELRDKCSVLHSNITTMEHELSVVKERYESAITTRDNDHSREMEKVIDALEVEREEAVSLRKKVLTIRSETDQIKQEQERKYMEDISAERKRMEAQLKAVQSQLEKELVRERDTNHQLMKQNNIELNKARLMSCSLDKRCKYLQTKQASLLLHVDQLDERCSHLQHELSIALSDKEGLLQDLADMKALLHQHDNTHKVILEEANSKHSERTSNLEQQLKLTQSLLEEERTKRMLMMEQPLLSDLGQLSSQQSAQEYVSANIARIHTLEEQNGLLRKQLLVRWSVVCHDDEVLQHPVRLWQDERSCRTYRGRLGHLVDALSHSKQQLASPSDRVTQRPKEAWCAVTMCPSCDRTICSDQERILHEQYCTTTL